MQINWVEELVNKGVPKDTADKFMDYHLTRKQIWQHFERFTLQAIASGKRIGAKAVIERIRWEVEIEECGEFKICNSFTAYYGRIFEIKHPHHSGFFQKRTITGLRSTDA